MTCIMIAATSKHLNSLQVTIIPREKWPLGQTVVKVNEQRERTNLFTREYLEQQLLTVLAGRSTIIFLSENIQIQACKLHFEFPLQTLESQLPRPCRKGS